MLCSRWRVLIKKSGPFGNGVWKPSDLQMSLKTKGPPERDWAQSTSLLSHWRRKSKADHRKRQKINMGGSQPAAGREEVAER